MQEVQELQYRLITEKIASHKISAIQVGGHADQKQN